MDGFLHGVAACRPRRELDRPRVFLVDLAQSTKASGALATGREWNGGVGSSRLSVDPTGSHRVEDCCAQRQDGTQERRGGEFRVDVRES